MTSKSNPSYENMNITGKYAAVDDGSGEIMLFGVRVKVDPMRKSVSMNDLSQYVQIQPGGPIISSSNSNNNSNSNLDSSVIAAAIDSGYPSADDAVRNPSHSGLGRKRGVPWTEDEHKLFLLGLEKVGKGDWRGISRNFVKTRTPTQVASHAQKYYLRRSNLNRRRRRSSLFDITTDSVAAGIRMEEDQERVNVEDNNSQFVTVSPLSGFPMAATVNLVPSPPPAIENQTETVTVTEDQISTGPTLVRPVPVFPTHERDSLSLSLSLNFSMSSTFHGFNKGDGVISVV